MLAAIPIILIAACVLLRHLFKRNQVLPSQGFVGPSPKLLFGNLFECHSVSLGLSLERWARQYGSTYAFMDGGCPILVTSDLKILREVLVKKSHCFNGRRLYPQTDETKALNLFSSRGEHWKRMRTEVAARAFPTIRIKQQVTRLNNGNREFVQKLMDQISAEEFDLLPLLGEYSLKMVVKLLVGESHFDSNDIQKIYHPWVVNIVTASMPKKIFYFISFLFPELKLLWSFLDTLPITHRLKGSSTLDQKFREIIDDCEQSSGFGESPTSFIEYLCQSRATYAEHFTTNSIFDVSRNASHNRLYNSSLQEIVEHSEFLLIAAYDTTTSTIAFTVHLLATYPLVQAKLHQELDQTDFEDKENPTFEEISQLVFVGQIIKESLRLYPHASIANTRSCNQDCEIAGYQIKKGTDIAVDVWTLHKNEDIWGKDANDFRPERFSAEESAGRDAVAWLPFGAGPRTCLGMRFAMVQLKLSLYHMFRRFEIQTTKGTQVYTVHRLRWVFIDASLDTNETLWSYNDAP